MVRVASFLALRDAVILVLFYFLILVGLVLLAALLGWEYVEKLARPYPLLSTFVIVAGTVGFAISMAAETLRDAEGEGSPLIKVRLISGFIILFRTVAGSGYMGRFSSRRQICHREECLPLVKESAANLGLSDPIEDSVDVRTCRCRRTRFTASSANPKFGTAYLSFYLRRQQIGRLADKILEDIGKHHVAAQDCIGIVAAFYALQGASEISRGA